MLTGHSSTILCSKFSNDGDLMASAGFDRDVLIWRVYNDCENFSVLKGHKNAVLDLHWSTDSSKLYTASADKSVSVWDMNTHQRQKKFTGHSTFVNSCHPARRGPELVVSGGDDCTVKIWDLRQKTYVKSFDNKYQITAVSFNNTAEEVRKF